MLRVFLLILLGGYLVCGFFGCAVAAVALVVGFGSAGSSYLFRTSATFLFVHKAACYDPPFYSPIVNSQITRNPTRLSIKVIQLTLFNRFLFTKSKPDSVGSTRSAAFSINPF